jgi:formamidase
VDFDGRILAQADPGPGEKVVVAPIELDTLRSERTRRMGHAMRAHLRSELYSYLDRPHLAPAQPHDHPLTLEGIRERIRDAKRREGDGG